MPRKVSEEKEPLLKRTRRKVEKVLKKEKDDKNEEEVVVEEKPKRGRKKKEEVVEKEEIVVDEKATKKEAEASNKEEKKEETAKKEAEVSVGDGIIIEKTPKRSAKFIGVDVIKSEEIIEEEINDNFNDFTKEDNEKEEQVFQELQKHFENQDVMIGEIYGVEHGEKPFENNVMFAIMFNGVKILIPDIAFFEDNFDFGRLYNTYSDERKIEERFKRGQYFNGSKVYFVIKSLKKEKIEQGYFEGQTTIKAYASRKEAMQKLRKEIFHEQKYGNIQVGDITYANILCVREDRVIADCLGTEVVIDAWNLNEDNCDNCHDYVSPGDKIRVRIKKLYLTSSRDVYLSVSGRLNDVSKAITTIRLEGRYSGKVTKYNPKNNTYTITLTNGVSASVRANKVWNSEQLIEGEEVFVIVKEIRPTFVIGKALKQQ